LFKIGNKSCLVKLWEFCNLTLCVPVTLAASDSGSFLHGKNRWT